MTTLPTFWARNCKATGWIMDISKTPPSGKHVDGLIFHDGYTFFCLRPSRRIETLVSKGAKVVVREGYDPYFFDVDLEIGGKRATRNALGESTLTLDEIEYLYALDSLDPQTKAERSPQL